MPPSLIPISSQFHKSPLIALKFQEKQGSFEVNLFHLILHFSNKLLNFFEMRKGSTRFPDVMRQTGGGRIGISHKPSKKVKTLRSVAGVDKLPKKLVDNGYTVNLVTVPRKSRSVLNKRYSDPSSPSRTNAISRCQMPSTDGSSKKAKLDPDEQHSIMKIEEEAVAGLLALAANAKTNEVKLNKISEVSASKTEDEFQKYAQIHDLNESDVKKDSKDVTVGNESRKRCASHVYICQIIKNLKNAKGKMVISHEEAKTVTTPETFMNLSTGINLNEAIPVSKNTFGSQPSGCGVQTYFGNPYCDPSQWSRPVFPNQQMWMNPFMYKALKSGSYVQASLHNVLGPKHYPSSGYDENGAMFRVDSPLTLKLSLQ
ncbi:hypothetical protein HanRHA438_Chr14g0633921 [Helianthus annuus]|uniref:Uncharacterized protein n=1 Tax=Helianthus annuus TaxID=4232 RepID=A0A9K3H4W1_HELAN|nr:uncharacterized protein LOC110908156 isoform X2 [Helianthus annuus]KAF5767410.1 hypothetical protein HanXRQr2_Chr14g0624021 [Helianthus annuus]KAJ0462957.1 hypothetical protein HanHA300_Chr14g0509861 [Helianthus annuus]KAJ0484315.1 hypothetical protein HanHA89_Chr14g0542771 [Helianthus annuus]KAJ0658603.1 hypothetical protein HanOQP8_Chr14g0510111 [Helianthus annuus]KAJ0838780.1 hypothetical protein HanPSC8_Chr14g0598841 [Helianthus annuus]